ncbi:recombinase family protein [Nocardia sp. NPDC050712]|uniref:recombinase family protein n=1 Tax=Nocardia sp. NPDC050712 TaxID=3155518 RepID=UPI0033D2DB03
MTARSGGIKAISILRAIIYARVSKDEAGGRSCREQVKSCRRDCEYEAWTVGVVLQDNDRGASRFSKRERENFAKLPEILRAGDVLVVWEPSRITRTMSEFSTFCDLLAARGVLLYYGGHVYDMDDDDDRNRVWQDILDGAKQVGKTRKRVLRALSDNRTELKPHGKAGAGYRIDRDPRTGKSLGRKPVPAQVRVLARAADMALDPDITVASLSNISRTLKPAWIKAGGVGAFRPEDVARILRNPSTFGMYVHDEKVLGKGTWEPALDPALMPRLASALEREKTTTRGTQPSHLLSYIAVCGVCVKAEKRGAICFRRVKSGDRYLEIYRCEEASHVSRAVAKVDVHVQEVLMRWLEKPDALALLSAAEEGDGGQVSVDVEMATIEQLRAEVTTFMRDAARRRMSADSVATYVEELETQIAEAQDRISSATAKVDTLVRDSFGPDARARWATRNLMEKRAVIRATAVVTIRPCETRGRSADVGVTVQPRNGTVT